MTIREAIAVIANSSLPAEAKPTDELRNAATVFAAACREANERLARCDNLILAGQRSEALRQSLIEPDLLKASADLNIGNCRQWMEFAGRNGLPAAIELNQNALRSLNAAFADEKTVEDLMKQYRMLALVRAPLKQRLDLVRLLSRTEPNNLAWREDLSEYETARLAELRSEINTARREKNHNLYVTLSAEIRDPNWVTPVPLDLLNAIQESENRSRQEVIGKRVRALQTRLNSAMHAADLDAGCDVEDELPSLKTEFLLTDDAPELAPLVAGLDWLDRESKRRKKLRNYDKALQNLRNALDHHFEWLSVQQHYEMVMAFGLPIPDDIVRDYRRRSDRTWLIRAGGIVILISILIIVCIVLALI